MPRIRLSARKRSLALTVAAAVAGATLYGVGAATAETSVPRTDREVPNLTHVVDQIKAYYGDTVDASGEHYASPTGNYAKQVAAIQAKAKRYLAHAVKHSTYGKPAIVLDVDDTTLLTYNYELEVGFNYSPTSNDTYIRTKTMAPVFGMPELVNWASAQGITVFYLTGRPEAQRAPSAANLAAVGYKPAADADHFFLKDKAHPPAYLPCGAPTWTCSTSDYKSGTRKHIESLGYNILANFGDQYSDLTGGHAEKDFKLPNPMYYLP